MEDILSGVRGQLAAKPAGKARNHDQEHAPTHIQHLVEKTAHL